MWNHPSLKRRLLACIAAGGLSLASVAIAPAADCGCNITCDSCSTCRSSSTCNCPLCKCKKPTCLFKAWDKVTGGFGKLFEKDKCGCEDQLCDDGCDAAMMHELTLPSPPLQHRHHLHHSPHEHSTHHPAPVHSAPVPRAYSGPMQEIQLSPTGPSQWEAAGQSTMPELEPEDAGQHLGGRGMGPEPANVPPPVRLNQDTPPVAPVPDPNMDRDSLFDTLSDPFQDDQTSKRTYRPVRPSNFQNDLLRPISKRPLSQSYMESSRRAKSVR